MKMQARHLPNAITALRLLLVLPLVGLLVAGHFAAALWLFALMGVSDALDGFLAKHYRWRSTLGEYLDPLADKTMLISTYLTLGWLNVLPGWLVAVVILRDLVIVAGAVTYHFVTRKLEMRPTLLSKVNTCMQILLVLVAIFDQFLVISDVILVMLIIIVLLTTVASGLDYVIEWSRRTRAASRA
jgi:cardiolipin synthase (CMP-forming)